MTRVAVALGSNLGDRRAHLEWAIARLAEYFDNLTVSSFIDTAPVGVDDDQPRYLNAVVAGDTTVEPRALLQILLTIEQERGRVRTSPGASRTLDLDLILYGNLIVNEPGLVVPHPRFRERAFVLTPLAEVAPAMVDPVTGKRVAELQAALGL